MARAGPSSKAPWKPCFPSVRPCRPPKGAPLDEEAVHRQATALAEEGYRVLALIGLSIFAGLPVPLLTVQILGLNLVTNGIQDVA